MEQLRHQISTLLQKERSYENQLAQAKKKSAEQQLEIEGLKAKNMIKTMDDQQNKSYQLQISSKQQEIYKLTVELGAIREENNELTKNLELQRDNF